MRSRWILWMLAVAVAALALAACADDADEVADDEPDDEEAPAEEPDDDDAEDDVDDDAAEATDDDAILIGGAIDRSADMAPFDDPAWVAAELMAEQINAAGGVDGRQIELVAIDTQLDPERTQSAALDLIDEGADVMFVTCDYDWSVPAAQEAISEGLLTIAPCLGDHIFGPPGFEGDGGRLAFTFGNASFAEGAALAEFAMDEGWETAVTVTDEAILYFQNVCRAFTERYEELGGEIVLEESFTQGDGTVEQVVGSVAGEDADTVALCSFPPDLPSYLAQLRATGVDAPLLAPWSGDGNFWIEAAPDLSDYYYVTFVSVFGDDPEDEVNELIAAFEERTGQPPATGGFVTGATAVQAIAEAVERAGTTDGEALADEFLAFDGFESVSGPITFSEGVHILTDRPFRLMEVQDGEFSVRELRAADEPPMP